jgi:hypothetical protein
LIIRIRGCRTGFATRRRRAATATATATATAAATATTGCAARHGDLR